MRMRGYSPGIRVYAPSYRLGPSYYPSPSHLFHSRTCDAPARRFGVADAIILGGTGYILYTAFIKPRDGSDRHHPLGEGASVASITLALSVPDRDDFYSILNKLKRLAESSDTSTRSGVQTLVSNGMWQLCVCVCLLDYFIMYLSIRASTRTSSCAWVVERGKCHHECQDHFIPL
jgi:hypothetical protein